MNVLIACEESQRVCTAFRERGHNAFSCDILPCSGGHPEWHIQGDVLQVLNPKTEIKPLITLYGNTSYKTNGIYFKTCDDIEHYVEKWDLIIAHPPCTRLCNTSQRWLYWGSEEYKAKKIKEQEEAVEFFMQFVNANCERIVIENPVGIMSSKYRKPDCIYNPYDFEGETECKKTALWCKGVSPLVPTRSCPLPKEQRTQGIFRSHFDGKVIGWNNPECAKMRSKTPIGVAQAMAEQWG